MKKGRWHNMIALTEINGLIAPSSYIENDILLESDYLIPDTKPASTTAIISNSVLQALTSPLSDFPQIAYPEIKPAAEIPQINYIDPVLVVTSPLIPVNTISQTGAIEVGYKEIGAANNVILESGDKIQDVIIPVQVTKETDKTTTINKVLDIIDSGIQAIVGDNSNKAIPIKSSDYKSDMNKVYFALGFAAIGFILLIIKK